MNKTNLRQLKRNLHGVSVVIGALMLTLIVVTAAASFAIFTAQKQEELQEQEFAQLLREQEELSVNKIVDLTYDSNENLSTLSFSVASQHTRSSKIVVLKINGNVISDFQVADQTNQQTQGWTLKGKYYRTAYFANDTDGNLYVFDDLNGNHKVDGDEINDVNILDYNPDGGDEANPEPGNQGYLYAKDANGEPYLFNDTGFDGFFNSTNPLKDWYNSSNDFFLDPDDNGIDATPADGDRGGIYPKFDDFKIDSMGQYIISIEDVADDIIYFEEHMEQNDALTIEVQTQLTNTFEKLFIPPTANFKVEISNDDELELDGSSSFHPQEDNEIVSYKWNIIHVITPFHQYTFKDLDDSGTYSQNDVVVNDTINVSSTQYYGHPGGLFALNGSNVSYIFDDVNENNFYDGPNSDDVILNLSKNESGVWCKPEIGNQGGLFANNLTGKPFIFTDWNKNWDFDVEQVVHFDFDGTDNAMISHGDQGGLYGTNGGEEYLFKDENGDWIYDEGDTVLEWDLDGDSTNANPSTSDDVGIIANDSSGNFYLIKDIDDDWTYDKEYNQPIVGTPSPTDKDQGYLYYEDASGNAYKFIDSDGDWELDTETIVNDNPDGGTTALPTIGEFGGLYALDDSNQPFTFRDLNGNWMYDAGEILSLNPDRCFGDTTPADPDPTANTFGGVFSEISSPNEYTFIDLNGNFKYDSGEILNYDPYGDGDGSTSPMVGDDGGLYAIESSDQPYIFKDEDEDSNWKFDGETVEIITGSRPPTVGDPGYLYGNDTGASNFYGFQDLNGNWQYDLGEDVSPHIGTPGFESDGNYGGLYVGDGSIAYFFRDENGNGLYDDEKVKDISASPTSIQGDPAGLLALNETGEKYTFIDEQKDWKFNNETLYTNPFQEIAAGNLDNVTTGGLFAAFNRTIYSSELGNSLLNNPFGEKKTIILEKPSWAETETMITLTVTDRFGMIGTYEYTLTLPPDKQ